MKNMILKNLLLCCSLLILNACGSDDKTVAPPSSEDKAPTVTIDGSATLSVTLGDKYTFIADAKDDNEVSSIIWSNDETGSSAEYEFASLGTEIVSVKVTDDAGQKAQAQVSVTVQAQVKGDDKPTVTIGGEASLTLIQGEQHTFTANAQDDNEISSIIWNNAVSGSNAEYVFASLGTKIVSVEVTDDAGQKAQAQVSVTVQAQVEGDDKPTVTIDGEASLTLTQGDKYSFTANAQDDNEIDTIIWSNTETGSSAEYVFASLGTEIVSVEVTDDAGQKAQAQVSVTVQAQVEGDDKPTVSIDGEASLTLTQGDKHTFTANAQDDNKIDTIIWSNTETGSSAEYVFASLGTEIVSVEVTDDAGQKAQAQVSVLVQKKEIDNPPTVTIAGATSIKVMQGDKLIFTADATDDKEVSSIVWSNALIGSSAEYLFDTLGTTVVSVMVEDDAGQQAQAELSVLVEAKVETGFTIYIDPANYSKAPTIWAWIDGGSDIHDLDANYTWNNQELMIVDPDSAYYSWTLPTQYQAEIDAGASLNFKIDKADMILSREKSGCYTKERWYNTVYECKNPPFTPYIGPYLTLVTPEFSGSDNTATVLDPTSNMIINYELKDVASNFEAQASYRKAGSQDWLVKSEDPQVTIGQGWGVVHHIRLTNLEPGTQYEYKVNDPDGQFTQQYHFTTAKTAMDYSHFLVVGDMQDPGNGIQRWQDVAAAISKDHMDDFDFVITVGDMVKDDIAENGDRFYFWQVFFNLGRDVFAYKAILPAMGNHDTPGNPDVVSSDDCGSNGSGALRDYCSNAEDTRSFRKYFYINPEMTYPDYYSYSYGSACFMSVNSEIPVFYDRYSNRPNQNHADQQSQWLSVEVDKAASCAWSFAYWHVPAINPIGTKTGEVPSLRKYVGKFNQKLDWSLTGHVHQYQRVKPVIATESNLDFQTNYGRSADKGVGYLTAAPAGQNPRNSTGSDMDQLAYWPGIKLGQPYQFAYEVGFTIIQVDGKKFKLETYGLGDADDNRSQPANYFHQDQKKVLLDSWEYSK